MWASAKSMSREETVNAAAYTRDLLAAMELLSPGVRGDCGLGVKVKLVRHLMTLVGIDLGRIRMFGERLAEAERQLLQQGAQVRAVSTWWCACNEGQPSIKVRAIKAISAIAKDRRYVYVGGPDVDAALLRAHVERCTLT